MKAAVIYWSGTGNTEQMAQAIAEGAGADLFAVSDFSGKLDAYDRVAFGCSAMGDEVLEESEFEPFFASIEGDLSGKTIALFGSYGWGDGEWMRNWEERAKNDGATLVGGEGLIVNETPDDEALEKCAALGAELVKE
jgi:flavodoxin short chain